MSSIRESSPDPTERMTLSPLIFLPPFFPRFPPWPWGPIPTFDRDQGGSGGGNLNEVVEIVYLRPDVRAAVGTLTQSFIELLSRNEKAAQQFNEVIGGLPTPGSQSERIAPAVIYGLAILAGAAVGYFSRK